MWWKAFCQHFWAVVEEALQGDYVPPEPAPQPPVVPVEVPLPTNPTPMPPTKAEQFYALAKAEIGVHLSLNEAVPWGVGCAEAVSWLLKHFGVLNLPAGGIEGTASLQAFLIDNPQFQEIYTYTPGAILVAATGTGNGKIRGHTGVCGHTSIMSNNSETGRWDTQWNEERWVAYYEGYGGFKTRYFLPV